MIVQGYAVDRDASRGPTEAQVAEMMRGKRAFAWHGMGPFFFEAATLELLEDCFVAHGMQTQLSCGGGPWMRENHCHCNRNGILEQSSKPYTLLINN